MRRVLEDTVLGRQYDIAQHAQFGVDGGRAIDGSNHRHLDIEMVHQQFLGVPINMVPALGRHIQPLLSGKAGDELVLRSSHDDDLVIRVTADIVKAAPQLGMRALSPA